MASRISGAFEYTDEGNLMGPSDYFTEKGEALYEACLSGDDPIYNIALTIPGRDPVMALLDRLDMDYTSWKHAANLASRSGAYQ